MWLLLTSQHAETGKCVKNRRISLLCLLPYTSEENKEPLSLCIGSTARAHGPQIASEPQDSWAQWQYGLPWEELPPTGETCRTKLMLTWISHSSSPCKLKTNIRNLNTCARQLCNFESGQSSKQCYMRDTVDFHERHCSFIMLRNK